MGKYVPYEDSNFRTFVIDTTAGTITRPKRVITKDNLLGAIIVVDGEEVLVVAAIETTTTITATAVVNGEITQLVYTFATDSFTLGEDDLDNALIDEFGRELITLE